MWREYLHPRSKDSRVDLYLMLDALTGDVVAVTEADASGQTRMLHDALSDL